MVAGESFGTYLRQLRESHGLTLRQAADAAQVSSGYLSQIEGGKRGKRKRGEHFAPHPQILRRLAEVYHVPAQELFEQAGFFKDREDFRGFSEEREIDRCFDFVIHDPILKQRLTAPDKRALIERYEALTGRRLITWGGEYSELAKKSDVKGLHLFGGALSAETVHVTLTLEEVARELDLSVDQVKDLVRDLHLRSTPGEKDRIDKAEIRSFKAYVMQEGLKLVQAYDRKHRPRTPEEYLAVGREVAGKKLERLKNKIRTQRQGEQDGESSAGKREAE